VWVTKSGKADPETFAAWDRYVSVFKEPHPKIARLRGPSGEPGTEVNTDFYITAQALARIKDKATATGKLRDELNRPLGSKPSGAAAKPTGGTKPATKPTAVGYVASTAAVQDVLIRLGWRGKGTTSGNISKDLTDGLYGPTVASNWQQSANKRKLDPSISKASADGKQVSVSEKTFLSLKALADSLVPPEKPLPAPPPSAATTIITEKRLNEVLGRILDAPQGSVTSWDKLVSVYQALAKDANRDGSIAKNVIRCVTTPCPPDQVVVTKSTWDALIVAYDKKAPAPPPPPPAQKSEVEQAMGTIKQAATVAVSAKTLKSYFNIAISQGALKREKFASEKWTADYAPLLIAMRQTDGTAKKAWEQLLVPGRLVAKDLTSVKLPADQAASIKKTVSDYEAAQKADTQTYKGFTKVNTATVIEAVNKLGVSTKQFNVSGGYKELADAIKTFYDNTKRSTPSGDLVKVSGAKDVFVQDTTLKALADEKQKAESRKSATEKYRKNMVAEALKASSKAVSIDNLQRAFIETVHAGKAGKDKALYSAVKMTGTFDAPTRAAYTELASVKTIGPAVLEFQKRLVAQRGSGDADLVRKVQNDTWDEFLKQAVIKDNFEGANRLIIKTLPAIADDINKVASAYRKRVSETEDERKKKAEADKLLAETVKKSNVILSIFDVQQGLLWAASKKEIAKQPSLKITGRADEATKVALFELSGKIFPAGIDKKKWSWDEYLDKVGIRVESAASVKMGWSGVNYVVLPQAAADYLAGRAELWMGKHGVPAGRGDLAPVPLSNQTLLLNIDKPSVITVKVPKKTDEVVIDDTADKKKAEEEDRKRKAKKKAEEAAAKAKKKAAEAKEKARKAKKKAEEAAAKAAKKKKEAEAAAELAAKNKADKEAQEAAARAKAEADAAAAEANKAALEAAAAQNAAVKADQEAAGGAGGAGASAGGQAAGGEGGQAQGGSVGPININIPGGGGFSPPAPEPTPEPAPAPGPTPAPEPAPVEPTQAGMFSPGAFMFMTAAGIGFMLFSRKDDKKQTAADARSRTRYSR
jgi:hypothetical protein